MTDTAQEVTTPGDDATPLPKRSQKWKGNRYSVFADGNDITVFRILPANDPHNPGGLSHIDGAPMVNKVEKIVKWINQNEALDGMEIAVMHFKMLGQVKAEVKRNVTLIKKPRVKFGESEPER